MNLGMGLMLGNLIPLSGTFDPSTVANMFVRYVAANAVVSAGVASLPNSGTLGSGAGVNDLAFAAAKPTFTASDAAFNGKPTVFHNNASRLTSGTFSAAIAQPSTWYAYTSLTSSADTNAVAIRLSAAGSSANAAALDVTPSTNAIKAGESNLLSVTGTQLYGKHLTCLVCNGASSALYIDDMTTPIVSGAGGTASCVSVAIGYFAATSPSLVWPEQIGYGGAHSQTTRTNVKSYFTGTYG